MNILTLGASSSKESINRKLARHAGERFREAFATDAVLTHLDLNDFELPLFSVDLENDDGSPENAKRFLAAIAASDALLISHAEHNGSYTAAYKNIFDWTSRIDRHLFQSKPAVFLSTSPGKGGGKNVLAAAVKSAPHFGAELVGSLAVPRFNDVFDDERGVLHDAALVAELTAVLQLLARRLSAPEQ